MVAIVLLWIASIVFQPAMPAPGESVGVHVRLQAEGPETAVKIVGAAMTGPHLSIYAERTGTPTDPELRTEIHTTVVAPQEGQVTVDFFVDGELAGAGSAVVAGHRVFLPAVSRGE